MLLVDRPRARGPRTTPLLHERVRPHDEVDVARCDAVPDLRAVLPGHRGREQRVRHARRTLPPPRGGIAAARPARRRGSARTRAPGTGPPPTRRGAPRPGGNAVREHLGGRHDRGLVTGADRDERRVHRDERLARTDVALQQDVHRPRASHRRVDLVVGPALGRGRLERQRPVQPFEQRYRPARAPRRSRRVRRGACGTPARARGRTARRTSTARSPRRAPAGTPGSGCHGSLGRTGQRLRADQVLGIGSGIGPSRSSARHTSSRIVRVVMPSVARWTGVIRPCASGPDRRPEELDLLVRQLEAPAVQRARCPRPRPRTLLVHRARPRLVEEREVEVARAVVERDRDHRLPAAGLPLGRPASRGAITVAWLPDLELADRRDLRAVDVPARVVVEEVADGLDALLGQDLGRGRPFRAQTDPACGELRDRSRSPGCRASGLGREAPWSGRLPRRRFYHATHDAPPPRPRHRVLGAARRGVRRERRLTTRAAPHRLRLRSRVHARGLPACARRAARHAGRGQRLGLVVRALPGEAPLLAAAHRSYGDRVRFLGVDVIDERDSARALHASVRLDLSERLRPDRERSATASGCSDSPSRSSTTPTASSWTRGPGRSPRRRSTPICTRSSRADRLIRRPVRGRLLPSLGHGRRLRHLREEAVLRHAVSPTPTAAPQAVEPERAAGPGARERHPQAPARLHELPQGRQGPARRLGAPRTTSRARSVPDLSRGTQLFRPFPR